MQVLIKYDLVYCNIRKYIKDIFQGGKLTFFFTSLLVLRPCMCCIAEAMELFTNLIENIVFGEHQFMFYVQKFYAVGR